MESITRQDLNLLKNELLQANREGINEVLEVIQTLATHVDQQFEAVDRRFDAADHRFESLETKVLRVETTMVTKEDIRHLVSKEYLEGRLAHMR